MKIRFWDRLILFFGALCAFAAGVGLVIFGLQLPGLSFIDVPLWLRTACIALGVLTVLFAVYLFAFPRKLRYRRHDFVIQQTDNGELRIAVKAIENLVQKCIDTHDEIHVVSMRIHNGRDGVIIDLCISLANNISIPLAVASLQKQIKQYLIASSGIEVKEVCVSVETAPSGVGESPYLVNAETQHAAAEKTAEEKPRRAVHQRIFGKAEEKATVPEPPAAQEPAAAPEQPKAEEAAAEAPVNQSAQEEAVENASAETDVPAAQDTGKEETENE